MKDSGEYNLLSKTLYFQDIDYVRNKVFLISNSVECNEG